MVCELERWFTEQIAKAEGITPEKVTPEYIRRRREEIYRNVRMDIGSHETQGLRVLTNNERDELLRLARLPE
ncbi:MAG: hypothetical protein V1895_00095 [Parcubacteria group bacterium]